MTTNTEVDPSKVNDAVETILIVLGDAGTPWQREAIAMFYSGEHHIIRRLAATHLDDHFCRSLGYLGSALKYTPNTDTILAEAARAAADHVRERTLKILSGAIADALK